MATLTRWPVLHRRAGRRITLARREARAGLTLISPTVVVVVVVVILPVLWTVMLAFQRIKLLNIRYAGIFGSYTLDNFRHVLASPDFVSSLVTTLIYTVVGTALSIGVGLIAALVVRGPFKGRAFVRGAMLVPYIAPVVAVTFVWQIMLNPQFGIANQWGLNFLGWHHPIPFLSEQTGIINLFGWGIHVPTALFTVIFFDAWRYFPFAFLFILARIQAIPGELEEAARVDGATPLQRFRYIIAPQLKTVIAVLAVLRFIWTFNKFDDIYLLTGGSAGTQVVSIKVYQILTSQADIGQSAAQAVVLAAILVVSLGVYFTFFGRSTDESGENA